MEVPDSVLVNILGVVVLPSRQVYSSTQSVERVIRRRLKVGVVHHILLDIEVLGEHGLPLRCSISHIDLKISKI